MDWLYIHLPHLYAETWVSHFHSKQPVALIQERSQLIEIINNAANKKGIDTGMAINTAFCLCPELEIITIDQHKQQEALQRVALIANNFSVWVGLDNPNGLYLEIASMKKLLGDAHKIQSTVTKEFQHKGFSTVVAAAPQPKAARLLAQAKQNSCVNQKQLLNQFKHIPIAALNVSEKIQVRLMKLGLRQLHDLAQLPSSDVGYRINNKLATHLDEVVGRKHWRPVPFVLPETFFWEQELEQEFDSLDPLRFLLAKGINHFCRFLQKRAIASRVLQLTLIHRKTPNTSIDISLASIDNRQESWQYMLTMVTNRTTLSAPITGMRLTCNQFETLSEQQARYLFSTVAHDSSEKKTLLLNRLSARLGINSLHFLHISTDSRPEYRTIYSTQPNTAAAAKDYETNQPLWLLPKPQEISTRHHTLLHGPVRFSTGWWDKHKIHRDYYIAIDFNLKTKWIFQEASGKWYQHGWFA